MKAARFDYVRARSLEHAVEALGEVESARIIAGGQSLGPMLNLRVAEPSRLVDVHACAQLRAIKEESGALVLGAALTHAEIEDRTVPDPTPGWLPAAARRIAYRAVRNRGTVGGSLAHADPAADWLTVMLGLGAEVLAFGPGGWRAERLADFVVGPFATTLGPGEIVAAVRVPKRSAGARWGYRKIAVKSGEFARAFAVAIDDPEAGERRVVIGAIERKPLVIEGDAGFIESIDDAETLVASHLPGLGAGPRRLHAAALDRALVALRTAGASA